MHTTARRRRFLSALQPRPFVLRRAARAEELARRRGEVQVKRGYGGGKNKFVSSRGRGRELDRSRARWFLVGFVLEFSAAAGN